MQQGVATLNQFELHSDFTQVSGQGKYDLNRHFVDASLSIDTTDLAAILPLFGIDSVRGFASLEVDASGAVEKNLKAQCHVGGYDIAYLPYPVGDLDCNGDVDPLDVAYIVNAVYLSQNAVCDGCAP